LRFGARLAKAPRRGTSDAVVPTPMRERTALCSRHKLRSCALALCLYTIVAIDVTRRSTPHRAAHVANNNANFQRLGNARRKENLLQLLRGGRDGGMNDLELEQTRETGWRYPKPGLWIKWVTLKRRRYRRQRFPSFASSTTKLLILDCTLHSTATYRT